MKTYTIYGNCQGEALSEILESSPNFKQHYELIKIKPVQLIEPKELDTIFNEVISKVDLLIYQPVSNTFKNDIRYSAINFLKHTKSKCRTISFPSCYFRGYHPELCFLKNSEGQSTQVPLYKSGKFLRICMVHDLNIIKAFVENKSVSEISHQITSEYFYSPQFIAENLQETLTELKNRENNLQTDIILSNFIEKQFQKKKLFHTFNHPSKHVFLYLATCILNFLNMKPHFVNALDPLGSLGFPIYNSTYKHSSFEFLDSYNYQVVDQELEVKAMVEQYYQAYKSMNKEILQEKVFHWNPAMQSLNIFA